MRIFRQLVPIAVLTATISFSLDAATVQKNADDAARAAQAGQPVTNPGYAQQVPNDATPSTNPRANSSYQSDQNGGTGVDLGWMGLLGLVGLFGLNRKRGHLEDPVGNPTAKH